MPWAPRSLSSAQRRQRPGSWPHSSCLQQPRTLRQYRAYNKAPSACSNSCVKNRVSIRALGALRSDSRVFTLNMVPRSFPEGALQQRWQLCEQQQHQYAPRRPAGGCAGAVSVPSRLRCCSLAGVPFCCSLMAGSCEAVAIQDNQVSAMKFHAIPSISCPATS